MFPQYSPQQIEPKWQRIWEEQGLYRATQGGNKPKFYCLDFFPYTSGEGLHVGHCRNYVPTDVISRFYRMRGYNVLHPMGWDAFGEPAEQYAVRSGVQPRETTNQNIATFRRQDILIGASYDWSREVDSSDPDYYRWTQWFFLLMYRRGLAYRDTNWQWWCPTCQTTLSSHEAVGGECWRGHKGVTKQPIPAWFFKITAYAEELISGLDTVDWPENIKAMQCNWIGKSEGVEIQFSVDDQKQITCFTTRPDTIFGVTFFILAPEHPLVAQITTSECRVEVEAYVAEAVRKSELDRTATDREKSGVFTGGFVVNPLNNERVPVWVADYVLLSYGTGAVMGVPAHDQRDFEYAQQFGIPTRVVIGPPGYEGGTLQQAYVQLGKMVNSGVFNGMASDEGAQRVTDYIIEHGLGRRTVQYRMHDWLISRQRYWGAPIPIIHCPACGEVPVPEDQLPVLLPPMQDFMPDGSGRSPLARVPEFVNTNCPKCGRAARRETDTMGGFACSSWYYYRFTSPHYAQGPFDPEAMRYWMLQATNNGAAKNGGMTRQAGVDLYVGGAEHAVMHLLYARFWTKVMADAGLVPFREPFATLKNQGQLMGSDGRRMSKSRGNVITPDSIAETYGADALRIYVMFMAPFEQNVAWSTDGITGARRFVNRVWNLYTETWYRPIPSGLDEEANRECDSQLERLLHKTIRKVTERIEGFRFNTMVSILMEFVNVLADRQREGAWHTATYVHALDTLLVLLAPAVPHITEELWQLTGHTGSIHQQAWPSYDPYLTSEDLTKVPVTVDGKVREVLAIPADASEDDAREQAFDQVRVQQFLVDREVMKVVYIKGKILNIVTRKKGNINDTLTPTI
jgi:leucyl-tRNA synthetase